MHHSYGIHGGNLMTMRELTYQVSFNTPAFLGNAEQQAQWRTPPFKALLRQWWRVVKAPEVGYDHHKLHPLENALFGSAADGPDAGRSGRSQVQLRLSSWDMGRMAELPRMAPQHHNEVKRNGQVVPVGTDVYLGFGPITTTAMRLAIAPDTPATTFKLRCPASEADTLRKAMQLAAWFGSMGSRARNGWGSLHIEGEGLLGLEGLCDSKLAEQAPLRSLNAALTDRLAADWPHALGLCADARPAVWRVFADKQLTDDKKLVFTGFKDWKSVLEKLAALKIGFRTQFKLTSGAPHKQVEDRHVLAYPVTNHGLAGLPNARLASQMRFKVAKNKDGQFFGLITHLPCAMPHAFFDRSTVHAPEIKHQIEVWQQVHDFLNSQPASLITRIRKG
jgi:CRISPR-associated protein Cmr1